MIFILDTDILSLFSQEDSPQAPRIRRRIVELPPEDAVVTTVINFEEQMRGWMGALRRAKSFTEENEIYDRLLKHLAAIRRMDVLEFNSAAAAITLASGGTLITRNAVDFRKVPNLKIDDWSTDAGD